MPDTLARHSEVMAFRRRRDSKLERIKALTGVRDRERVVALGRIADLVDATEDPSSLDDHYGARHAVAVLSGFCVMQRTGAAYAAGDVFVTEPFDRVATRDAVVLVAPVTYAAQLLDLLPAPATRLSGHREQSPIVPGARNASARAS